MNIANELRKLADQIEGTTLNTIEEKNIQRYSPNIIMKKWEDLFESLFVFFSTARAGDPT